MTTKHHITNAEKIYVGAGYVPQIHASNERNGIEIMPLTKVSLGSPVAADVDYILDAATSTELPNTATTTYTTADDGASPFDNADTPAVSTITTSTGASASVWALDVPRNISVNATHVSSLVAMTVVVTGYDTYLEQVAESFSITATGTDKTAAGKKAFAYVESIAITSAGDATANTLNVGIADVLGLPFKLAAIADCLRVYFNDALDDSATVVAAVTTTATATTGDVRGTVDPNSACDGSAVVAWMYVAGRNTAASIKGVDLYGG